MESCVVDSNRLVSAENSLYGSTHSLVWSVASWRELLCAGALVVNIGDIAQVDDILIYGSVAACLGRVGLTFDPG